MDEEGMEEKHKKEQKELHNKIQGLKHSVPKGDKKKKKEVNAEIARLQAQLDEKHKEELKNAKNDEGSDIAAKTENLSIDGKDGDDVAIDTQTQKISRAQKRRDKKQAEEKARQKRLEEGEEESVNHARNVEAKLFEKLFRREKLKVSEVQADGDCLYNAISLQLNGHIRMDVATLREQTSKVLLTNSSDYIMFTTDASGNMLSPDDYEKYCLDIKNTKAWGGQLELKAITQILKQPIKVYQANTAPIMFGEEFHGTPVLLSYHRHQYGLGEHYNALLPDNT